MTKKLNSMNTASKRNLIGGRVSYLKDHRFGGNGERQREVMNVSINPNALTAPGSEQNIVLDVGFGDGCRIAALDRIAPTRTVSTKQYLHHIVSPCREIAADTGVSDRCRFVASALPELDRMAHQSVDVAVMRSVLIYVADKRTAFTHLHRVLRPGWANYGPRTR